jgi:hypothetical protein
MIPWREAFPEFQGNETGATLSGYRHREGITQIQLALLQGNMRPHQKPHKRKREPALFANSL